MIRWAIARVLAVAIPLRFDPDQAAGIDSTLELRVGVRGRLAVMTIAIADRRCVVRPGPSPDATAAATVSLANLIRVAVGDAGWPQLMSRGSFQLSGDPFLALRLATLFRLPAAAHDRSGRPVRERWRLSGRWRLSERPLRPVRDQPGHSASPR